MNIQYVGARRAVPLLLMLLLVAGCTQQPQASALPANEVDVVVEVTPLREPAACEDRFVAHDLAHTTSVERPVQLFESNGAGLALNDLDRDGDIDIVLASRRGPNTILWNQGDLAFQKETFGVGRARGVGIVDVDADGRLDIVLTTGTAAPQFWRNTGGSFERTVLSGVREPAYSHAWADFDLDGDLDLVTGSYDAGLFLEQTNSFLFSDGAGVFYYENRGGDFVATRLATEAQALTIIIPDLNNDEHPDILVGNDFDMYDFAWTWSGAGWQPAKPFAETSHSTMSLAQGDVDNDGTPEIFSADMKPYDRSVETMAAWLPLMERMRKPHKRGDPQIMENTLQVRRQDGTFVNEAYARGIDAAGWSWSSTFGDLDNDGYVDLYVANGMIAEELFDHLPNSELVERNQAFRNRGNGHFTPTPHWKLGSIRSGRGMSMADLDQDGDLDIVVNNLGAPAQLFENRLCGGNALEIDLFVPNTDNTRAFGAQVMLRTSAGTYHRDVHAGSGYLSGSPARLHVGFPDDATLHELRVRWPDGTVSHVTELTKNRLLRITQTE